MSPLHIVTDSTTDVPPDRAADLGISVVPAHVFFGSEDLRDGVDIAPEAFFARLATTGERVRTSQPGAGDFFYTYSRLLQESGEGSVLSIHVAGSLSGTVNSAWAAAQMLPDPTCVDVVDTGQLSMGAGWVVIKAAEWARSGLSLAQVASAVRAALPRQRVVAMIDSLDYLRRGGRVGHVTAALGTLLQIKPLLAIQSGTVTIADRVRTRTKALTRIAEMVRSWGPLDELAVLHTGAEDLADALLGLLDGVIPAGRTLVTPAGPSLTAHLGLGAVGACALQSPA